MRGDRPRQTEQSGGDQDETTPQPPEILGRAGVALQATVTRLINTLRGLLRNVGSLLQAVVSWLRRILAALTHGFAVLMQFIASAAR